MKKSLMLAFLVFGCSSDPVTSSDAAPDVSEAVSNGQTTTDGGMAEDARLNPDVSDAGIDTLLAANDYCELTAEMFCDYYLRCGRIAATGPSDCRSQFLESCNEAYEPQYVGLADLGHLALSSDGMRACASHLRTVACERQVFDLDGGCAEMWQGQVPSGGQCAPGIGSFVCGEGTDCVLDLSFCGTCEPVGVVGEACVDERCAANAVCVAAECVGRGLPGDPCSDELPCVVGIACSAGTCAPRMTVGVNDACDQERRCPYQSTCREGVCRQDGLLGEPCVDASCASGWCDGAICRSFVSPGDNCGAAFQCLGGACEGGNCGEPIPSCFRD